MTKDKPMTIKEVDQGRKLTESVEKRLRDKVQTFLIFLIGLGLGAGVTLHILYG